MGKTRTRNKRAKREVEKLNQVIIQQHELIKSGKSMDAVPFNVGTQISPSSFWGNPSNEFGFNDPTVNTVWLPPYEFTYQELTNLYKNPLVRRVIKLNMDDGTRAGFELTLTDDAEKAVDIKKEMDKRFNWLALGRKMIGIKHNYGGGVLFADIDDGRKPDEPLNENNVRKVWSFRPIDRFFAHPVSTEESLGVEKPGQPMHYKITIHDFKGGKSFNVHESRLIRYPTFESDDILTGPERQRRITWDIPTVQIIYDGIKRYGVGMQTGSSLLQGFVVDIFKTDLKNVKDLKGLRDYVKDQWLLRNSLNANVMGIEDELERMSTPITGIEEITKDQRRDVGMVTEIPVPILFSEESGTLGGSTLAESKKVWYSKVSANQKNRDEHMYRSMLNFVGMEGESFTTEDIEDIGFRFNSLEYLSEMERAELEFKDAETAEKFYNMGLPEKDIFGAKLTGPEQKIGALNYDQDAFEKALEDSEELESEQSRLELEGIEADLEGKKQAIEVTDDEKKANLADANKSTDEETHQFIWT